MKTMTPEQRATMPEVKHPQEDLLRENITKVEQMTKDLRRQRVEQIRLAWPDERDRPEKLRKLVVEHTIDTGE
jgi:hypothetical protein